MFIAGRKWYVVVTKDMAEKKVAQALSKKNIPFLLPTVTTKKQHWDGSFSQIQTPLFKNYVFVYTSAVTIDTIKKIDGVSNMLYWLADYACVSDLEIDLIRQYSTTYEKITVERITLPSQNSVARLKTISSATLTKEQIRTCVLPTLGYRLTAIDYVRIDKLEKEAV